MNRLLKLFTVVFTLMFFGVLFSMITRENTPPVFFRELKVRHQPKILNNNAVRTLARMSNITNMNELLDNICIERTVGSDGHKKVKNYIVKTMKSLGWTIEKDKFRDMTPFGPEEFENIVTKLNKDATRYLTLACHYDSKIMEEGIFEGATDSAVPCSQMINLATVMKNHLDTLKYTDVSLMFIFFDGEEAFREWNSKDSIYGAKNLAKKWHSIPLQYGYETDLTELDRIDLLVLLDLLGAANPDFYNYFKNTEFWYRQMGLAEQVLANNKMLKDYSPRNSYFKPASFNAKIEDDHLPFLQRDVPILHLIPSPFPSSWHTLEDNRDNIDMNTIENLNKILRIFVAAYFHLDV